MKTLLSLLIVSLAMPVMAGETLSVAAASDLAACMDELGAAFRQQAPRAELKVATGASGTLYAQIRNGAPFDVFMSADMDYPARLAREGGADAATLLHYASGQLVLWSLDARFDPQRGLSMLDDTRITRIAVANPDVAPYGRAARAALQAGGMWDAVAPRLVTGENVAQTVQFVQTRNAQAGIVPLSALMSPALTEHGRYALLPGAPVAQGAVVTVHGRRNPLALQWMQFLVSPAARAVFTRHGLLPPAAR